MLDTFKSHKYGNKNIRYHCAYLSVNCVTLRCHLPEHHPTATMSCGEPQTWRQEMMKNKIKPQKVNNTTNISVRL